MKEDGIATTVDDRDRAMLAALERHFGFTAFRPGQREAVRAVLDGRDVMALMPTGGGKSVCYQLPATVPGRFTLVITPLRALMRDQVTHLKELGIAAALIDQETPTQEQNDIYAAACEGVLSILYVSPERLSTPMFQNFTARRRIDLLAVDEAHCVLHWGADFRPAYLRIGAFIASLEHRPVVIALTATASVAQADEICTLLGLHDPVCVRTGADRPNITLHAVEATGRERERIMGDWIATHPGSGIVYRESRKDCERLASVFRSQGIDADFFHAEMPETDKRRVQDGFTAGSPRVIVATSAFGMGVDKPDVRWVINDGPCKSLEAFWQEAGRAGRDGKPADSLLLWSPGDFSWLRKITRQAIETAEASEDPDRIKAATLMKDRVNAMSRYCETTGCLRRPILAMFDETPPANCGNCGNCRTGIDPTPTREGRTRGRTRRTGGTRRDGRTTPTRHPVTVAPTEDQSTLRSRYRTVCTFVRNVIDTLGHSVGASMLADALKGADTSRVRKAGLDRIPGYGTLAGVERVRILALFDTLIDLQAVVRGDYRTIIPGPLFDMYAREKDE